MEKTPKQKKCRICKEKFIPFKTTQVVCSTACAFKESKKVREKDWKKRKAKLKEESLTHKDWLKKAQFYFNAYIRERDKDKPCVSCDKPLDTKFDAGHFYSVGAHPELRFLESNVHGQCVHCNQHLHGNLHGYYERIERRVGERSWGLLQMKRNLPRKYSIPELKEMIDNYKQLTKELKTD